MQIYPTTIIDHLTIINRRVKRTKVIIIHCAGAREWKIWAIFSVYLGDL